MIIDETFKTVFDTAPAAIGEAHGRVNLIGEHLDYNGGMVLPTAIAQKAMVALGPGEGAYDDIHSPAFDATVRRPVASAAGGSWSDYVAGALAMARGLGLIEGGVRLAVESDVPPGAGLSSSAAVIVAVLKAALALRLAADKDAPAAPVGNVEIAQWAQKVEHDYIGVPVGIMDQMAVAIAGHGQALALDTATLDYKLVDLPEDHHFAIVHSGVTRKLEDGRYAERRRECEEAAKLLGVAHLCLMDARAAAQLETLPPALMRRARHAYHEHQRVLAAIKALRAHDIKTLGRLMNESHASMRDDFEVSTPEIDALVAGALEYGASGARLTGGGFGGCIVACIASDRLDQWRASLEGAFSNARMIG